MTPGAGIFRTLLPIGFTAGGINCGVRRYRPDLGIIISESACVTTAVLTKNVCKAAPVKYCESLLPANNIKAIITNSGQANAATGELGELNNKRVVAAVAEALDCDAKQILTASTGVIGAQLAIDNITNAIPELVKNVSNIAEKFAVSILTTDLVPKTVYKEVMLSRGKIHITGICKGSGMIHPNMATMLGYLLTDANLTLEQSQTLLKATCDKSFNMISVDGETSTNDCVFLMANGMSDVAIENEKDYGIFAQAMEEVAVVLAKSIARDGEGASKLIEVTVKGLEDVYLLKSIARNVTTSALVKTAAYGASPNWGRVLAKIGNEAISAEMLEMCEISMQNMPVYANGQPIPDPTGTSLKNKMTEDTIFIVVDFFSGEKSVTAWGCDLTERYVKINAEYLS